MGSDEPAQDPPTPSVASPIRFGNYLLERRLGQGGMAEVWKGRIGGVKGFQKVVCIKRVLRHLAASEQHIQMFIEEAKLSARLSHPNVAQVFELGEVDGEFYIAMEYVRGRDLQRVQGDCMEANDPLPPAAAAYVAREMCHALAYAHEFVDDDGQPIPIIHRDVSPHNVMLGDDGRVKLVDFGVAKALMRGSEHSPSGLVKGKLAYLAPEQLQRLAVSPQTDIFAAGTVFWEMLTNERLFIGESDAITVHRLSTLQVEPPSSRNPRVPAVLDRIAMKALEREPADRYHAAAQMAQELERFCAESHFTALAMRQILFDRRSRAAALRGEPAPRLTPGGSFDAQGDDVMRGGSFDGALSIPIESSNPVSGPRPAPAPPPPRTDDINARPTQALSVLQTPPPATLLLPTISAEKDAPPANGAKTEPAATPGPSRPPDKTAPPPPPPPRGRAILVVAAALVLAVLAFVARGLLLSPPPPAPAAMPADAAIAATPMDAAIAVAAAPPAHAADAGASLDAAPIADAGDRDAGDMKKKRSHRSATIDPFDDEKVSDAEQRMREANQHFNTGDYAAAKEDSVAALLAGASPRKVWRLLGPVSCHLRDEKRAKESLKYLSSDDKERTIKLCRDEGIELE